MSFQIGDAVRVGAHIGTVIDVGTVLIQLKTNDGCLRVARPWEAVKIPSPQGSAGTIEPATKCSS